MEINVKIRRGLLLTLCLSSRSTVSSKPLHRPATNTSMTSSHGIGVNESSQRESIPFGQLALTRPLPIVVKVARVLIGLS